MLDEAVAIDSADLVKDHKPMLALKKTGNAKGVWMTSRRQWCHDMGPEVGIEFIRGYDHTGPHFLYLFAHSGVKIDQENVATANRNGFHHSHSASSNIVG